MDKPRARTSNIERRSQIEISALKLSRTWISKGLKVCSSRVATGEWYSHHFQQLPHSHTNPPWKSLSKDEESYQSNTTSLFSSFFEIGRLRTKNNKTLIMKDLWNGVAPFEGSRNAWIVSLMSRKFRNQKSCACYSNCKNQSIAQTSGSKKKYSWLLGLFQSLGTNTIQIEDLTAATILETPHIIRDDEYLFIKTNEENP